MAKASQQQTIQQLGGRARTRALTAQRRREIAVNASKDAQRRRLGLPSQRELSRRWVAAIAEVDPKLASLIRVTVESEEAGNVIVDRLTAEELTFVESAFMHVVTEALAEAKQ